MTSVCPRCSTPRASDYPICQVCGLDFRSLAYAAGPTGAAPSAVTQASPYGSSDAPPAQPAQSAAATCPRCHAPLYPGYTRCGNCGFDWAQQAWAPGAPPYGVTPAYGALAPAVKPADSKLAVLFALGGVVLLAVAGGLVLAVAIKAAPATASTSASAVAIVKPANTPLPTFNYHATPIPTAEPTLADATVEPSAGAPLAVDTPEPSPLAAWTSYAAPDKKWTVRFPSAMAPLNQSLPLNSGVVKGDMTMYVVVDTLSTAYTVAYIDFPTGTIPGGSSAVLKTLESSMAASLSGTLVTSSDAKVGSIPARDMTVDASGLTYNLRLFIVNDRFYILMVMADPGATVYPQHFFSTFALK